jgi:hypothetical protein
MVANAAGKVPPFTHAKKLPLALAVNKGSSAAAMARTTSFAGIPCSGECDGNIDRMSSGVPREATSRVSNEAR